MSVLTLPLPTITVKRSRVGGDLVPKIVDHERRRQELVEAAWRVINRIGLEHTTIREIATESGYSTGALAHYFATNSSVRRTFYFYQRRHTITVD